MKILCIEDDKSLLKLLRQLLVKQHYQVDLATNGEAGWDLAEIFAYDLILLDWMLPKLSGIDFCQKLRTKNPFKVNPNQDTPVLLMTALDTTTSKVIGLDAGADDYIVKPFNFDEFLARIRALLRRQYSDQAPLLQWGELCLNLSKREVRYGEESIQLSQKEYQLLELFLRNPEEILSISQLVDCLRTGEKTPTQGAVRTHLKSLRHKFKQAGMIDPLETVYKMGYRLKRLNKTEDDSQIDQEQGLGSVSELSSSPVPPELWETWQECRPSYCDRISILQQAATALKLGTLTPEQQHQAKREAHTLVGSLGSFHLEESSRISRQIEQIFSQLQLSASSETEPLIQLITQLITALNCALPHENPSDLAPFHYPSTSIVPIAGKLLIVDDDLTFTENIRKEASNWDIYTKIATSIEEAETFVNIGSCNAVLLDLNFLNSPKTALEFLATVSRQHPNIPVIILTAEETFEKRVEAARFGSHYFLHKPIVPSQVLAVVVQAVRQTNQSIARILIVDDDPALLQFLSALLAPCGYQLTLLSDADKFWETLEQTDPDLLILDIELSKPSESEPKLPPISGIELCQVIRSDLRWNRLTVIFLSVYNDMATVQRGFMAGADDFLSKPVVAQDLLIRLRTRLKHRKLWEAIELDELTGVSLRHKALQDLTRLLHLAQREQQPFSLAILDLDHFKHINDEYGHEMGDRVLTYFGKLLDKSFRAEDVIGRWGGEEFVIGMYGITKIEGSKRLENVLEKLKNYVFIPSNGKSFRVTFSAGIAQFSENGNDLQALYQTADQALYGAKVAGRSRIFAANRLTLLEN